MKPTSYDFGQAIKLENYVRRQYPKQLSNGALSFYLCAFQTLERAGLGLCNPITRGHRELAEAGVVNKNSVRKYLNELNGVLCEMVNGSSIKTEKLATQIRRYSLDELRNGEPRRKLVDYSPPDARELAELLYHRPFVYGDNLACRPSWNVLRTGRVSSSNPNVQGDSEELRIAKLSTGLKEGQVLISADFNVAEPTLIQEMIGYHFKCNPYLMAADLLQIDTKSAKQKVNSLAYHPDSKKALSFWQCPHAEKEFMPYAEALTAYKNKLWFIGKPRNGKRRFVNTLSGRKIEASKGKTPHRGQILSWVIQGTVAEILNSACLKIIEHEPSKLWKFCFPVHDSVYVIGAPEQANEVGAILEVEAKRLNLPLTTTVDVYPKGVGV